LLHWRANNGLMWRSGRVAQQDHGGCQENVAQRAPRGHQGYKDRLVRLGSRGSREWPEKGLQGRVGLPGLEDRLERLARRVSKGRVGSKVRPASVACQDHADRKGFRGWSAKTGLLARLG
jgi:hypothetical protein